ncbi:MAG: C69 family dipeptidase [Promethearchaeota archaeon]
MCDTFIALGSVTEDGSVIFGKNSDRLMSEAQLITYQPKINYPHDSILKCSFIEIPQVLESASVILSQPYWMWGAEMGANEYGVVIGNEAIATIEPLKDQGLLGMDLLRLGLERGKNAEDALKVITDLLEQFGQGGRHNQKGFNYHNSFIIADPNQAFVLETAGEWWIAEKVKKFRSISNDISIRGKGDLRRKGIIQHAIQMNYCKDDDDFDFSTAFSANNKMPSYMKYSMNRLSENEGKITPEIMMGFLREHEGNICRHKRNDFTASSQVSHLRKKNKSIHWFTGSALTCMSLFKPYIFPIEKMNAIKAEQYEEVKNDWFWMKHLNHIRSFIKNPLKENPDRTHFIKVLMNNEKDLINKINDISSNETRFSDEQLLNEFQSLNNLSWKKAVEPIE